MCVTWPTDLALLLDHASPVLLEHVVMWREAIVILIRCHLDLSVLSRHRPVARLYASVSGSAYPYAYVWESVSWSDATLTCRSGPDLALLHVCTPWWVSVGILMYTCERVCADPMLLGLVGLVPTSPCCTCVWFSKCACISSCMFVRESVLIWCFFDLLLVLHRHSILSVCISDLVSLWVWESVCTDSMPS